MHHSFALAERSAVAPQRRQVAAARQNARLGHHLLSVPRRKAGAGRARNLPRSRRGLPTRVPRRGLTQTHATPEISPFAKGASPPRPELHWMQSEAIATIATS